MSVLLTRFPPLFPSKSVSISKPASRCRHGRQPFPSDFQASFQTKAALSRCPDCISTPSKHFRKGVGNVWVVPLKLRRRMFAKSLEGVEGLEIKPGYVFLAASLAPRFGSFPEQSGKGNSNPPQKLVDDLFISEIYQQKESDR